ncbi:MAG TPA: N-acetylmuramoyl-L-alanine amidase CwlD [Desulfobacteria bacterium]|nr:N-acetylmuramoyl-L-alanine amidase CwlD [Desulfobacteria bacterium]
MRISYAGVIRPRKLALTGITAVLALGLLIYVGGFGSAKRILSWSVAGKTIVIDPGHGGVDPGAVGPNKVLEKDINLAVAKRLKDYIQQGGGRVIMIREEDVDLSSPETSGLLAKKREDLAKRLAIAEESKADLYISVHTNSFPGQNLTGAQTFYHKESAQGMAVGKAIQAELVREFPDNKRVAKSNQDFFVLKKNSVPAVTVEVGFISNPAEETKLQDPEHQNKLAVAIYRGISKYFNEP